MQKSTLFTTVTVLVLSLIISVQVLAQDNVTLRVLVHQNPSMVEFMEQFNADFEAANPSITVDMAVVAPGDLSTVTQTRLTAGDVDVIDIFGFANASQPYMVDVTPPNWQQLIEAGLLLDLTDQDFVANYAEAAIRDAGSYDGRVYAINLGRVIYSGIFINKDLFAEFEVEIPTTWDGLVAACETFTEAGISCMTAGGADGWPIFVGAYGLHGSLFPDQEGYVEGLWTGEIQYNDEANVVMWERMQIYARDMIEQGASGLAADAAPGRFASGVVAMLPAGSWNASTLEAAEPEFDWGYIPFPGSDNAEDNSHWFGKYDQGWAVAADSPNQEAALAYLAAFSEPENYNAFANTVGFIPTQPTALLETKIGEEVAPYLDNFLVGFEQYWIAPTGTGQWATPWANHFAPFNEWEVPAELADRAQSDLQAGLDTVNSD